MSGGGGLTIRPQGAQRMTGSLIKAMDVVVGSLSYEKGGGLEEGELKIGPEWRAAVYCPFIGFPFVFLPFLCQVLAATPSARERCHVLVNIRGMFHCFCVPLCASVCLCVPMCASVCFCVLLCVSACLCVFMGVSVFIV